VKLSGWGDAAAARAEIEASVARFNAAPTRPNF
jgi:hypothetical protein